MHARPEHRASIRLLPADVLKSKTFIEADCMAVHSASIKVFFYDKILCKQHVLTVFCTN